MALSTDSPAEKGDFKVKLDGKTLFIANHSPGKKRLAINITMICKFHVLNWSSISGFRWGWDDGRKSQKIDHIGNLF
jgi:chaperone required for assembly of F1-ATPase